MSKKLKGRLIWGLGGLFLVVAMAAVSSSDGRGEKIFVGFACLCIFAFFAMLVDFYSNGER